MNNPKNENNVMLTFRCQQPLSDALNLVARHNGLSRSSVIRILLIQVLKEKAETLIPSPAKNKRKKAVDSKATA